MDVGGGGDAGEWKRAKAKTAQGTAGTGSADVDSLRDEEGECAKLWAGLIFGDEMDNQAGI